MRYRFRRSNIENEIGKMYWGKRQTANPYSIHIPYHFLFKKKWN